MDRRLRRVPYLLTLVAGLVAGVALRSCAPWPPVPDAATKCVVVYESQDLTPEQAAILASATLRSYLETSPYWWRIVDQDVTDRTGQPPAPLRPYLDRARAKPLPWLMLADPHDSITYEGQLPASDTALIALLRQHAPQRQ